MTKECYQLSHPKRQTYCFQIAGRKPCSNSDCAVIKSISTDVVVRMASTPEEKIAVIKSRLLHQVCRMSSSSRDNSEFLKRTKKS
jgi:hypothetical protein